MFYNSSHGRHETTERGVIDHVRHTSTDMGAIPVGNPTRGF